MPKLPSKRGILTKPSAKAAIEQTRRIKDLEMAWIKIRGKPWSIFKFARTRWPHAVQFRNRRRGQRSKPISSEIHTHSEMGLAIPSGQDYCSFLIGFLKRRPVRNCHIASLNHGKVIGYFSIHATKHLLKLPKPELKTLIGEIDRILLFASSIEALRGHDGPMIRALLLKRKLITERKTPMPWYKFSEELKQFVPVQK